MMRVVVDDEAEEELLAAAEWYENERAGLGTELLDEAVLAMETIAGAPETWPLADRSSAVRRFRLARFPYVAYYVVRTDEVLVLAFGHMRRRPGYWRHRQQP